MPNQYNPFNLNTNLSLPSSYTPRFTWWTSSNTNKGINTYMNNLRAWHSDQRSWLPKKQKSKSKSKQKVDSRNVRNWDDYNAVVKQQEKSLEDWLEESAERHSRETDNYSIKRGYKIKLVDGKDMWGKPVKYYYFVHPDGTLGNKVSKYYLQDNGYDMAGIKPVVYHDTGEENGIRSIHGSISSDIRKEAARNVEGPSSLDLANHTLGGIFNFSSPTTVYGGIMGALRKDQSVVGALQNTLFGYDAVDPEKSGNYGLLETTNGTANWAAEHPYITGGINMAGDMAALGGISKALGGGFGGFRGTPAGTNVGRGVNQALGKVGNWANRAQTFSTNVTTQLGQKGLQTVRSVPGGNGIYNWGKGTYSWGKSALGTARGYGNRALQWIPQGTGTWTSNAWTNSRNFLGRFKPVNLFNRGLRSTTGYYLTPNARTGFKTLGTLYGLGQTGYNLFSGEDTDVTKFGKVLKYTPGLTFLDKPYTWYSDANSAYDTYAKLMDMYDYGVTPEGVYDTGQGVVNTFGG